MIVYNLDKELCMLRALVIIMFTFSYIPILDLQIQNSVESKITKLLNSEENSTRKVPNQMIKHIKRMDNNCHNSDLVKQYTNNSFANISDMTNPDEIGISENG